MESGRLLAKAADCNKVVGDKEGSGYRTRKSTLAQQNRLDRLLPLVEEFIPNTPAVIYGGLSRTLCYKNHLAQAKIVKQRLQQRYPDVVIAIGDQRSVGNRQCP